VLASLVNKVTGKSLRKGAMTELAMHPQCDIFISSFRSGHALDSAMQYYFDKANVGLSINGARCLAGYKHKYKTLFASVQLADIRPVRAIASRKGHPLLDAPQSDAGVWQLARLASWVPPAAQLLRTPTRIYS